MAKSNSDFVFHTDDDVEFFSAELFELMNVSFSAPYDRGVGRHVLWRNHQVCWLLGLPIFASIISPSSLLYVGVMYSIAQ